MPVRLKCKVCRKEYTRPPSRASKSSYCTQACSLENLRRLAKKRTGRRHQNWVTRETAKCKGCRRKITRRKDRAREPVYCTNACKARHQARTMLRAGPTHPAWKGGSVQYRGPNWASQRAAALSRDGGICATCGATTNIVHHKKPFQLFTNYKQANRLRNLVTLCKRCHAKEERKFWRSYGGPTSIHPYRFPNIACKKCGETFNAKDGAKTKNGLLRICRNCRSVICEVCGSRFDKTQRRRPRFCDRKCADKWRRRHRRQLGQEMVEACGAKWETKKGEDE